jgi:hypothetical protein
MAGQRRLADTGLADEQDQRAITFCRHSERRLQLWKFSLAPDEGLTLGDLVLGQLRLYELIRSRRVRSHWRCSAL